MNKYIYTILLIFNSLLAAFSQILLKFAARQKYSSFWKQYLNFKVVLAYIIFLLTILINIFVMKNVNMTIVSVFSNASPYILAIISGAIIFGEKLALYKLLGATVIIIGIILVVV